MRNISLEIENIGDRGKFYFKATSDMVINKQIGHLLLQYRLK